MKHHSRACCTVPRQVLTDRVSKKIQQNKKSGSSGSLRQLLVSAAPHAADSSEVNLLLKVQRLPLHDASFSWVLLLRLPAPLLRGDRSIHPVKTTSQLFDCGDGLQSVCDP